MILVLSVRFRRYIALFLYCVFYSQLIMATGQLRASGDGILNHYPRNHATPTSPLPHIPSRPIPTSLPDSVIVPSRNAKMPDFSLSPSFRYPATPQQKTSSIGGPTQPEMESFKSVNTNNMVDLFTGDFSYNIPLLDVGGYPVNISYHSGRSMDEDASWVGLGWNINPGSVTREMRGLPDDFSGGYDTIRKVANIKANTTVGVTGGANVEIVGTPIGLGANIGVFNNTYNGWGAEIGINASISVGLKGAGTQTSGEGSTDNNSAASDSSHNSSSLSAGLSLTDNSQTGITINPSLGYRFQYHALQDIGSPSVGLQLSAPYNSRTGLKDIQLGVTVATQTKVDAHRQDKKKESYFNSGVDVASPGITFSWPSYTPTISLPMTNVNYTFTAKLGGEATVAHPNFFLSGYFTKEYVAAADTALSLPAYGYLNYQNRGSAYTALVDFNREKELPYRENPPVPHIAIPSYTYDVFSMSGEGTGGMFRAYRGDIGFIADHLISNKTQSAALSVDFGGGAIVHSGVDLNANYSTTTSGPWLSENPLRNTINFRPSNGLFEAAYFRNPGEKAINTTDFYNAIGGDYVAVAGLYQNNSSISTTNTLNLFNGEKPMGSTNLTDQNAVRTTRDKRAEVITYLTAAEASISGLDKYIRRYDVNQFGHYCENDTLPDAAGPGTGLAGYYYTNQGLQGQPDQTRYNQNVFNQWQDSDPLYFSSLTGSDKSDRNFPEAHWSARWLGRYKAPASGTFRMGFWVDDGLRFWINDSLLINDWRDHGNTWDTTRVNLIAGKLYNIRIEYYQDGGHDQLEWNVRRPDLTYTRGWDHNAYDSVPRILLYPPVTTDTIPINPIVTAEDRVNAFRKPNHLSEIDVLNPDGRRYVYGIPVYNLIQKEVSFSVNSNSGNIQTGLTAYSSQDNSTHNSEGKDGYYSREEIPAYAHSFLLTGILSPDYVDVTGDGISDDDLGDAVRFDYSKTSGIANPYGWRAPYVADSATYNEGFRSYNRDDKANYIYGTKELWYLHTIESKTMIANFTLQSRSDLLGVDENGNRIDSSKAMCLKQIDLYSKADWLKSGSAAVPIKTVHFVYDYSLCPGVNSPVDNLGKLTLKEIWFTYNGNNKGILNPYMFNYHPNNPGYRVNMADKWGTYKNPAQNPGATPSNPITNAEYPYSLQDSAAAANNAGAWSLDSITLPSGGRIKVNYESDDYAYVQNRRSTLMCKIAGIGTDTSGQGYSNRLYSFLNALNGLSDGLYIYIKVPYAPASDADLYARYLAGISKLYFRLYVAMPKDDFGSGSEYIPCYADPDSSLAHWYGVLPSNPNIIWVKIKGVNSSATGDGNLSPLAQTAINFLRLNLPDKAYPGSEMPDNLSNEDRIKIALSMLTNITGLLNGFTNTARGNGWASSIDTSRSFVRLDCPTFKKFGGGSRVQSVLIYDNWNAMTGQKETVFGQIYNYTTTTSVNGVPATISSGVASWEPGVGAEENPFHLPIEYVQKTSILGPASMQYTEEPLGESFYPGPSIGYSRVRVRSIHTTGTRSANGYAESTFYTTFDFPTSFDYSQLDNNSKKRYKPLLSNFLRVNVQNFLALSQGFKVELNDMNGKSHTEATYSETDTVHPLSYTENFYKVDNQSVQFKHLNNTVTTIDPLGNINTNATIGKDAEMMADMRDQTTNVTGANINLNADMFTLGPWPVIIPSLLNLYQHETDQFRSVALTKIIQRYGILDSVVQINKGSKISTKNLMYDAETGEALLTRTQNEFNDSVFQFNYPAHWVYPGLSPAYQNIDAVLSHLQVDHGKIVGGLTSPDTTYLTAGDELLVASRQTISGSYCNASQLSFGSFPDSFRLWVVDTSLINDGPRSLYIMDQYGTPFSGNDVSIKVTRSGYRNQGGNVGSVTSLANPLVADGQGVLHLVFDTTRKVISAAANELQQTWRVSDKRRSNILTTCVFTSQDSAAAASENCSCLKPFFDYLIRTGQLYQFSLFHRQTVGSIAAAAGINLNSCPLLANNANTFFRTATPDPNSPLYEAYLGKVLIKIASISGAPMNLATMTSSTCNGLGQVIYKNPSLVAPAPDTVTVNLYPVSYANLISGIGNSCPSYLDNLQLIDSVTDHLLVENDLSINNATRNAVSVLNFGRIDNQLPAGVDTVVSAQLMLTADLRGHYPPQLTNANSVNPVDTMGVSLVSPAGWFPNQLLDTVLYQAYYAPLFTDAANTSPFQNLTVDLTNYMNGYINRGRPIYTSTNFVLSQGGGNLHSNHYDSSLVTLDAVPPYMLGGYGNYYATYYSTRYPDTTKWPVLQVKYLHYSTVDTMGAVLNYNGTESCTTVIGRSCYSSVTDTLVNPYQYGLLGAYRPLKAYVYYGRRAETDPGQPTNIRTNGVISNFAPFWTLQSGHWTPSYDSSRWVWKTQSTLYNRKGFELENKDPLGQYNSGIYGYDLTLPMAVTQNSRYQESAYEGFEDYGFTSNSCDTTCAEARPFDFSNYSANISDSAAHTGQYSLRVPAGGNISFIGLPVAAAPDPDIPQLSDSLSAGPGGGVYCNTFYNGSKASAASVLPPFKPFANKQMLVGAWVKEQDSCSCQTYSNDHLVVTFSLSGGGDSTISLLPSGNMIEGWQRYVAIILIPATATGMTLTLQASGSSTTYFDDIRLHPFNAEMKSYVYNSTTLRLMAELDENNYATFYEYDDDGTLIRVKKETERGVMTIKETRSALMKNQ
jgi:hypothetical protein